MSDTHELIVFDKTACELIDQFLPPEGTAITAAELEKRVAMLMEAARELERLRQEVVEPEAES